MSMTREFGIYVHVPYCRVQCPYCTFFTIARPHSAAPMQRAVRALEQEWRLRVGPRLAAGDRARTLYLGGGTPSDLPAADLFAFLDAAAADLPGGLAGLDEVTVECNPESAGPALLDGLRARGTGRVSLGVQAVDDRDLRVLGRGGTAADARRAVAHVAERFPTWSADLILGIPGSEPARALGALAELAEAGAPHLSFYCLELPPERARRLGDLQTDASEAAKAELYLATSAWAERHGYHHYEISSAAHAGHRARHNSSYWSGMDYVGLGPGAHSLEDGVRSANRPDLESYLAALEAGRVPPVSRERLTAQMRRDELLLCGLRRSEGIPVSWVEAAGALLGRLESVGRAQISQGRFRLTPAGWLVSDAIVLQLVAALDAAGPRIDNEIAQWLDSPV